MHLLCGRAQALIAGAIRVAGLALAALASQASADAPFAFDATPGTLPKDVVPLEYRLHLAPELAAGTFRGTQTVSLDVLRATRRIVMHAHDLGVESARLEGPQLPRTTLAPAIADGPRQTITYALPLPLAPGRYELTMAWHGTINVAPEGLFADRYQDATGARMLLATDFEPTAARRVWPCWDEPSFRARYHLSVDLPAAFSGYSNTPVEADEPLAGGRHRLAFAKTPAMPSYLLVLVAGELERLTARVDGTEVGVVVTAGKLGRSAEALAMGIEILHYYNGYFGTPYPLPKLDHIGLPGGFAGGMENWGGIVYNESLLLVDPETGSDAQRQRVFGLIAHETAHQWFGNLVTMGWWDDLWLNEAFSDWMQENAARRLRPQWQTGLDAAESSRQAMVLDALPSTHPIRQPVEDESEEEEAFDDITYKKGAGFLRMLEAHLGEATFRRGVQAYLRRHAYGNTTGADLWAALAETSSEPVAPIAADWTTQPGFPLVSVDARCEAGQRRVALSQRQFSADGTDAAADRLWNVPLQLGETGSAGAAHVLLRGRGETMSLAGCEGPLVVDPDDVGYFRVRYAPALFDALAGRFPRLNDGVRFRLLADTSALAQAGLEPLARHFELLAQLGGEPRVVLWQQAIEDLETFDRLIAAGPLRAALRRHAVRLLAPRFTALGWDERAGESADDRRLRPILAVALSRFDDPMTIAEGRTRFSRFLADPKSVAPSLVAAVARIAGRHADAATFLALRQRAEKAPSAEERFGYYAALAEVQDAALVGQALQLALAPDVPLLVRHRMLRDVARNGGHVDVAWRYAREHADALTADVKLYGQAKYFAAIVSGSVAPALADELEAYVAARLPSVSQADVRRTADAVRARSRLQARLLPQLTAVLAGR